MDVLGVGIRDADRVRGNDYSGTSHSATANEVKEAREVAKKMVNQAKANPENEFAEEATGVAEPEQPTAPVEAVEPQPEKPKGKKGEKKAKETKPAKTEKKVGKEKKAKGPNQFQKIMNGECPHCGGDLLEGSTICEHCEQEIPGGAKTQGPYRDPYEEDRQKARKARAAKMDMIQKALMSRFK